MNVCVFVGNLTRDPELSETPSGVAVCKFAIAVNRPYANANGEHEADYINVVTWRGLAENCGKYLSKGNKVAVVGSLQTSSYEDKEGIKRYRTDLVANNVEFIRTDANTPVEPQGAPQTKRKKTVNELKPIDDSDLPF